MKGDVVLDFVLFQLTAPRTRCELFVSSDGMHEKLASGFLKPFMNHLRALEEQVAGGCECVKLECPQIYHGRAWFTKGTVERFVRFVSTPEVLERVKSIEDELVQLEQVRSIQASLPQADDPFLGADPVYLRKDGKALSGPVGKNGGSKLFKRYPYDAIESTEASKVELLRAMDVRMLALRQEQSTAFGRAAAAGFNSENMTDLMAFSEYFGADRLGAACCNFLLVLERRGAEPMKPNLPAMSSGGHMSLPSAGVISIAEGSPQGSALLSHHKTDDAKHHPDDGTILTVKDGLLLSSQIDATDFDRSSNNNKGIGGAAEARKRWGPPANIRPQLFGDETQINDASAFSNMEAPHIKGKSETGFSEKAIINDPGDGPSHSLADPGQVTAAVSKNTSALNRDDELKSQALNGIHEENKGVVSRPGRRLSVQDAINMFEDKKQKQLIKVPGKQHLVKQDSTRLSTEGSKASPSGSVASRRSSAAANGSELGSGVQGSQESGTGDFVLPRQDLLAVEPQGPASESVIHHWSCSTMKKDELSGKVSGTKEENLSATFGKMLGKNFPDPVCLSLESTLQGMLARDVPAKQGPSKWEPNLHMARSASFVNRDQVPLAKPDMMGCRNHEIEANSGVASNDHGIRESFCSSGVDFFQHGTQNHASMDANQASADDEHRGRLYEHYRKLRDAKLMEENDSRRAQREAKLKSMEETLLLRKAELDAQQQSRTGYHQARAAKLQARKTDFYTLQRKEDGVDDRYGDVISYFDDGSISPSFTPVVVKEQASTSKPQSGKKHAAGSTKGATPPRSSNRGTSVSPKSTPRSALGSATKSRKSAALNVNENALAKSAPSFAILRKENTKPSPGRPLSNVNLQDKDGGSGRFRAVNDTHPLEANMNALGCTSPPGNGPVKVSAPLKVQREVDPETTPLSETIRSNGYCSYQEAKQFSIKGSNSGHLLGMIQQLPLPTVAATYESYEESAPIITYHRTHDNIETLEDIQGVVSQADTFEVEDMDGDVMGEAHSGSTNSAAFQMLGTADASGDQEPQYSAIDGDAATPLKDDVEFYPRSQLLDNNQEESTGRYIANTSTSFRASSLPRELHMPAFLCGSPSPPNSRVVEAGVVSAGHFGASVDTTVKSSRESPVNWKLFASEAGVTRLNKKWAGTQKLAMAVPTKEPGKGLKRLLKFARKNRAVDATSSDWVSTSDGDDEFEDQRLSMEELRGQLEERIIPDMNGENTATPEKVTPAPSLRSSIPTPPTNFRLRDDHLMGTTMLKAPKSFFSLSSFRNKGIEGKAR